MKALAAFALTVSIAALAGAADDPAAPAAPAPAGSAAARAATDKYAVKPEDAHFCLYAGVPTGGAQFSKGKALETSRETYGGVKDELIRFVATAKAAGADAVINYNGAQHFGFWPWRLVRPLVRGVPIKWTGPAPDCVASGGATYETVMATNQEPPRK